MPNSHSTKWAHHPLAVIPLNCDLEQWNVASWTQKLCQLKKLNIFEGSLSDEETRSAIHVRWEDEEKGARQGQHPCQPVTPPAAEQLAFPQKRTHHLSKEGQAPGNCKLLKDQTELSDLHPSCLVICYPTDNNSHFTHDTRVFENNLDSQLFPQVLRPLSIFAFWKQFPCCVFPWMAVCTFRFHR